MFSKLIGSSIENKWFLTNQFHPIAKIDQTLGEIA